MHEAATVDSTVDVLLFSVLKDQVGTSSLRIKLGDAASVGVLLERVVEAHPSVASFLPSIRVAVNREYVDAEHPVRPGDEVALITPVSGG